MSITVTPKASFICGYKAAMKDAARYPRMSGRFMSKRLELEWGNYLARQRERALYLERRAK